MIYLKQYLFQHKGKVLLTVLLLLGQVVGTLLIPALLAELVDQGILAGNISVIWNTGVKMLAVTVMATAAAAWGSWATSDLSAAFGREMRLMVVQKSQALAIQQFDQIGISSTITRTTSDIANLERTIGMVFQMIVPAPLDCDRLHYHDGTRSCRHGSDSISLYGSAFRPCGLCPQAF